jgi:hypothetical protein
MTSTTATVATLTAEVRVLMVGSRQVTMSVYNQLDTADRQDAELFGRVSPKYAQPGYLYLVGRHRDNGSLVRMRIAGSAATIEAESDLWLAIHDRRSRAEFLSGYIERHLKNPNHPCRSTDHSQCLVSVYHRGDLKRREIQDVETDIERLTAEASELQIDGDREMAAALAVAADAAALPLIVLAGLR